jgi:lipoic acid synthetase
MIMPVQPKPPWLKRRLPTGSNFEQVRRLLAQGGLHTVCQEAKCPNIWECFSKHTATFMILGDRCSRNCGFCAVAQGPVGDPDPAEAERVAEAAERLQLRYVVVTSVTRDDLSDGGAGLFAATIEAIRKRRPETCVEVLIPDFQGDRQALQTVVGAHPHVLNHNVETVARLYPRVRPQADYRQSLVLLKQVKQMDASVRTKSGLMLGLGESEVEVLQTLKDLREAECNLLTLGQYLQPTPQHLPVEQFVTPEAFDQWRNKALALGFDEVASGPFVRSSYHAHETYQAATG